GVTRYLIDVSKPAQRKALLAQQHTMGAHASASGRMRSEEHTSELQSHGDRHSFPPRRPSDLGVTRYLIDVSKPAQRKALLAQQHTMGAHASASGRMQAMNVGQGLDFRVPGR